MDREFLEKNGIDVQKGLELLSDMDTYNDIMGEFLNEINDKYQKLVQYRQDNDMENYAIVVHSIKSDSKYLGFTHLAELAYEHELKSKENNIDFVNTNFEELNLEINRIVDIIKQYLGEEYGK